MIRNNYMKRLALIGLCFSLLCAFGIRANEAPFREGELIIQIKKQINIKSLQNDFASIGLKPVKVLSKRMNIWLFRYDVQRALSSTALNNVLSRPEVINAQLNHYVKLRETIPNDPKFANQWDKYNTGQNGGTLGADIDAPEAWDFATGGVTQQGDTIVVAIIDEGFDLTHSDLDFWKNKYEIPNDSIDNDNNGYIDDYDGWNAYDSNGNIPSSDHGTHVSGIAAAIGNNDKGVSGVNWDAKIMPIAGAGEEESVVIEAYGYVLEMRAKYNETNGDSGAFVVVTNSSFGVDRGDPADYPIWCAMYDSMGAQGILSCAATANANWDIDVIGDMPTACPSDWLISVTNTTNTDAKNGAAAYGATTIDLGAPGTSVYSTLPGDSYGIKTGTSMATPNVAGAVALLFSAASSSLIRNYKKNPGPMALLFKDWILSGADSIPSLQGITVTGGRLNAYNSVLLVQTYPDSLDPAEPLDLSVYSDYSTPTSIQLNWTDPTNYFGGDSLFPSDFNVQIMRDGLLVDSVPGGIELYQDTGLIDGQEYNYTIFSKVIATDSISPKVSASWIAGGSPIPDPPMTFFLKNAGVDDLLAHWTNPTTNVDGTPMDDFNAIKLYKNGILLTTFARSPSDTGRADSALFPLSGPNPPYYVTAVDNELPPNESAASNIAYPPFAAISLSTNSIVFDTTSIGENTINSFTVENVGQDTLRVYDMLISNAAFSVDTPAFTLLPTETQEVKVTFSPTEQGLYSGIIRVISNDPVNDTLYVAVRGYGETITGMKDRFGLPSSYGISSNYPNPFNPTTTIRYQLPQQSDVKLYIYNVLGQKVKTLVEGSIEAGYHSVVWDGRNDMGIQLASGIYIYRFSADDYFKVQKMILIK